MKHDENNPNNVTIIPTFKEDKTSPREGTSSAVFYNPENRNGKDDPGFPIKKKDGSSGASPFIFLGHELVHAQQFKTKTYDQSIIQGLTDVDSGLKNVMTKSEYEARQQENKIREEQNIILRDLSPLP